MKMLKKNKDFREIYKKKNSIANQNLVMYSAPNGLEHSRLGISVSKKVGNAYTRNKIKRRIKEILRINEDKIKDGYDIIFIARVSAVDLEYKELEVSVFHLIEKKNLRN